MILSHSRSLEFSLLTSNLFWLPRNRSQGPPSSQTYHRQAHCLPSYLPGSAGGSLLGASFRPHWLQTPFKIQHSSLPLGGLLTLFQACWMWMSHLWAGCPTSGLLRLLWLQLSWREFPLCDGSRTSQRYSWRPGLLLCAALRSNCFMLRRQAAVWRRSSQCSRVLSQRWCDP